MKFDTKIAVVVRDDLATWQKLNVTAFTVSGIAAHVEGVIGEPYEDGSGNVYLPMLRQPVLVFSASADQILRAYERALRRNVRCAIYTEELFSTGHDEANRAAVKACASDELKLAGMALRDQRKVVDRVLDGLMLHQ
ncbi:MAG: DUF2000 family protein [Chloroflexales bacterium]|nr:DUF2000 family protein [Chloroflexales bacterium]